jgi:hypothetical protein
LLGEGLEWRLVTSRRSLTSAAHSPSYSGIAGMVAASRERVYRGISSSHACMRALECDGLGLPLPAASAALPSPLTPVPRLRNALHIPSSSGLTAPFHFTARHLSSTAATAGGEGGKARQMRRPSVKVVLLKVKGGRGQRGVSAAARACHEVYRALHGPRCEDRIPAAVAALTATKECSNLVLVSSWPLPQPSVLSPAGLPTLKCAGRTWVGQGW